MSKASEEVLINVEGVSKKFCRSLKRSLWYGIKDIYAELTGGRNNNDLRKGEFWAVKNVSFELRRGECLGLIGHNGAGKSTLLKMLNGLIKPDEGRIEMNGRVGALIELGAGFNPILTGRENVYNNAAVLGFKKEEIDAKYDDIVEFAELEEFMETPVQSYSSGMRVRLGFAVAAQLEPDILLIDEVLAVGDVGFRIKCFSLIDHLLKNTAIIFVSHQMPQVSRIAHLLLLLEYGTPKYNSGDVASGIDLYYQRFLQNSSTYEKVDGKIELTKVYVKSPSEEEILLTGEDLEVVVEFEAPLEIKTIYLGIIILNQDHSPIGIVVERSPIPIEFCHETQTQKIVHARLLIPKLNLSKGFYTLSLYVSEEFQKHSLARFDSVLQFQVTSDIDIYPPIEFEGKWKIDT